MSKIYFFIRSYKYDVATALFSLLSYFIAFRYAPNEKIILLLSVVITFVSFLLILFLRLREKDFYFRDLTKREHKDEWIGRGVFEYRLSNDAYLITNSETGYIFSKTLNWADYSYTFEFKILNHCLGAVVRAVNLSDYVMFQIRREGIRPHIRINGGWRPWEAEESGLLFDDKLSSDMWYKCTLVCEKDLINISIRQGNNTLIDRSWEIPHERLSFPFPQSEEDAKPTIIHFPIDLNFGSVGFRNAGREKALVKNLLIEKI